MFGNNEKLCHSVYCFLQTIKVSSIITPNDQVVNNWNLETIKKKQTNTTLIVIITPNVMYL